MAQKNQKQAEKTAKMNESAQAQTQEVETNVAETTKEETQEVEEKDSESSKEETLEQKALRIKKDWNVDKIFYCNGQFYATEAEAIKAGAKGFAYYIF